jgi:hypothetical protein
MSNPFIEREQERKARADALEKIEAVEQENKPQKEDQAKRPKKERSSGNALFKVAPSRSKERKNVGIHVLVTESMKKELDDAAEEAGYRSVNAFLFAVIEKYLELNRS